jgi:hypothetical protein
MFDFKWITHGVLPLNAPVQGRFCCSLSFFSLMKKRKKKNQEKISLPPHKPAQARPIPASRQAGFLACAHEMLKL